MPLAMSRHAVLACTFGVLFGAACAPSSLVDVAPPNTVADPSLVSSATGAVQLYNFGVQRLASVMAGDWGQFSNDYVIGSAMWTDELQRVQTSSQPDAGSDERFNDVTFNNLSFVLYYGLHSARVEAAQAREALRTYAPTTSAALQSRMFSHEAYAILALAEIFCSGIPLTSVPITGGTPAYTRGFTTQELFEHAAALFDSALTLAGDSTRFASLANIGKGRALLALGRFADAASAVADVPTNFLYKLEVGQTTLDVSLIGKKPQIGQATDHEGGNGLVWSTDPRTGVVTTPTLSGAMKVPGKYSITAGGTIDATTSMPGSPMRLADGLEARLIEAEAALALNDPSWLTKLNALRSGCVGTATCAPVPGLTAALLPPLGDPGNADARLNLLMGERAMWLYLTGHRQGDLRRMARVYHRDPQTLWPMGVYVNAGFPPLIPPTTSNGATSYSTIVVLQTYAYDTPVNPLYAGCVDLNP